MKQQTTKSSTKWEKKNLEILIFLYGDSQQKTIEKTGWQYDDYFIVKNGNFVEITHIPSMMMINPPGLSLRLIKKAKKFIKFLVKTNKQIPFPISPQDALSLRKDRRRVIEIMKAYTDVIEEYVTATC